MADHRCDNASCKYNDNHKCIEFYYVIQGVRNCSKYKRERKDADELYSSLFKEDDNGTDDIDK